MADSPGNRSHRAVRPGRKKPSRNTWRALLAMALGYYPPNLLPEYSSGRRAWNCFRKRKPPIAAGGEKNPHFSGNGAGKIPQLTRRRVELTRSALLPRFNAPGAAWQAAGGDAGRSTSFQVAPTRRLSLENRSRCGCVIPRTSWI